MARVARVLLSVSASSAVLERELARPGVSLRVPGATYPQPTMRWSCSSTETPNTFPLKCRLSQLSTRSRRYLAVSPTRRRRWPPFLRARQGLRGKRAWTSTTMSTQGRRGLWEKRALTPAAATPQGKARTRSLGDEWGAAVNLLRCCCVSACSSRFCFLSGDVYYFCLCLLRFFLHPVVGYASPCWRDGDARISNAAVCQYGRNDCCCVVMRSMKLSANAAICVGSTVCVLIHKVLVSASAYQVYFFWR